MAAVNIASIEEYADRIVYKYLAGRYEQVPAAIATVVTPGLKTLVNTDTTREYNIPATGESAKFYKVDLYISTCLSAVNTGTGSTDVLVRQDFFRVSIPTLKFDGKSPITEFYDKQSSFIIPSSQLRQLSMGNISLEPSLMTTNLQWSAGQGYTFAGNANWVALIQPIVTFYKK